MESAPTPLSGRRGKGGNLSTQRNPFQMKQDRSESCPSVADQAQLGRAMDVLLDAGCAILIGRTRDGSTIVITILDGENRHRTYCTNDDELSDAIQAIQDLYAA